MHQKEIYEQTVGNNIEVKVSPTIEQVKERVKLFLRHGDPKQVVEWILQNTDGEIYEMMWRKMQEWEDVRYRDEYDNLAELGWIDDALMKYKVDLKSEVTTWHNDIFGNPNED